METYKRANVVLETTKKRSKIALCYTTKFNGSSTESVQELQISKMQNGINNGLGFFFNEHSPDKAPIHMDMYITISENIFKGDWYLSYINGEFLGAYEAESNIDKIIDNRTWQVINVKIIATTRPSILKRSNLPSVSKSFIEKYVEKHNQNKRITQVLVEFVKAEIKSISTKRPTINVKANILKTNPKDNTIIIKKIQDQFSREELIEYMWKAYEVSNTTYTSKEALRKEFDDIVNTLIL